MSERVPYARLAPDGVQAMRALGAYLAGERRWGSVPCVPRTLAEYLPGQQEAPVALTSLADMLRWAQNYARSRPIWPLDFGLA